MASCRRMRRIDAAMAEACECRARAGRSILTGLRLRTLRAGDRGNDRKRGRCEYHAHYEGRGHFDLPGGVTLGDRRAHWCEVTPLYGSPCEPVHKDGYRLISFTRSTSSTATRLRTPRVYRE